MIDLRENKIDQSKSDKIKTTFFDRFLNSIIFEVKNESEGNAF